MNIPNLDPNAPVSIIYPTFNRLEFTKKSISSILKFTDFSLVRSFTIYDFYSKDGTFEYCKNLGFDIVQGNFSNANFSLNLFIASHRKSDLTYLVKIDNDIVVKPSWLTLAFNFLNSRNSVGTLFLSKRCPFPIPCSSSIHGGVFCTRFSLCSIFRGFPQGGKYPGCHSYHKFVLDKGFKIFCHPSTALDLTYSEPALVQKYKGLDYTRGRI